MALIFCIGQWRRQQNCPKVIRIRVYRKLHQVARDWLPACQDLSTEVRVGGHPLDFSCQAPVRILSQVNGLVMLCCTNCSDAVFSSVVIVTLSRNSHPSGSNAVKLAPWLSPQKIISATQVSTQFV